MVIARRGDNEVARWSGPMDWYWDLPMRFVGTRRGERWTFTDPQAESLAVQSPDRRQGGVPVAEWAARKRADHIEIILVPHPGAADSGAGAEGMGTQGDGAGSQRGAPGEVSASPGGFGSEPGAVGSSASRADTGDTDSKTTEPAGQGQRGMGIGAGGQGRAGGQGAAEGVVGGHEQGSDSPSWTQPASAEIDNESGGRTPAAHGKRGGSPGGQRHGEGHLAGFRNGLLDVSAELAVAINAAILIVDADLAGLGQKFLTRTVKGLSGKALRKALKNEAEAFIEGKLAQAMRTIKASPDYRKLSRAERASVREQVRDAIERSYYDTLSNQLARQVSESEALVRQSAARRGEVNQRARDLAEENAAAYRKMELATLDNAPDANDIAPTSRRASTLDELGEGPEAGAVHEVGARAAGVVGKAGQRLTERHHLLPREHKQWFQERGFPGDDIDNFCIELDVTGHQAIHGGGDWKLARKVWSEGEWNTALMNQLRREERRKQRRLGRKLNRGEILRFVRKLMTKKHLDRFPIVPYKSSKR